LSENSQPAAGGTCVRTNLGRHHFSSRAQCVWRGVPGEEHAVLPEALGDDVVDLPLADRLDLHLDRDRAQPMTATAAI
jgi:hypothetical protein